jgi:NAD(P)-dependent dehydrogenase (short-subunit alcohol dehydrogenase family)
MEPDASPTAALDAFRLDGRTVIVTGASSGLGYGCAQALSGAGANVVAVARRSDRLKQLATEAASIVPLVCDVTAPDAAQIMVEAAVDEFGALDVVVNNAGLCRALPAVADTAEGFRHELEVDLVAPYELARAAAAWMIDRGRPGSIINVTSILGAVGGGKLRAPGYAAAKGGLANLTRELASQWARKQIRVNGIGPGWFASEMTDDMFDSDDGLAYIVDHTPMGRPGRPGELHGALLFLASDASSYVTGQILYVDGGWTAI